MSNKLFDFLTKGVKSRKSDIGIHYIKFPRKNNGYGTNNLRHLSHTKVEILSEF